MGTRPRRGGSGRHRDKKRGTMRIVDESFKSGDHTDGVRQEFGGGGGSGCLRFEVACRLPCAPTSSRTARTAHLPLHSAKLALGCRVATPDPRRSWLMRCRARPDLPRSTRQSASRNRVSESHLKPPRIAPGAASVSCSCSDQVRFCFGCLFLRGASGIGNGDISMQKDLSITTLDGMEFVAGMDARSGPVFGTRRLCSLQAVQHGGQHGAPQPL